MINFWHLPITSILKIQISSLGKLILRISLILYPPHRPHGKSTTRITILYTNCTWISDSMAPSKKKIWVIWLFQYKFAKASKPKPLLKIGSLNKAYLFWYWQRTKLQIVVKPSRLVFALDPKRIIFVRCC